MARVSRTFRLVVIGAAVWLTASAEFPMDLIGWLLGEVGCC
ncbi:MAG: hypothetical protein ABR613_01950 [Actinomycetota bacterium]